MNGLLSGKPSPSAIRLTVGGFLLLFVQALLLMLAPGLMLQIRIMIWVVTSLSGVSLIAAVVGLPDPPTEHWRRRHGRR